MDPNNSVKKEVVVYFGFISVVIKQDYKKKKVTWDWSQSVWSLTAAVCHKPKYGKCPKISNTKVSG